ncbi:MAG TPA: hypothetical protein DCS07_10295 [Bdellovibrionales bacterium]|nr:MAG: hypothetical protein A2Z97_16030 [Bdellovibrionales bacterium GWB1_52_6]OFZ03064.1 MAG: hypothetical protein A2X97_09480 [Bdellovibrionales bacterium GWA1_52_35]OFZ43301.1 MAG: hypothetical protein A2070_07700 [Bdellovibrionales bacterium GWC1_52_8]HAR43000.1 hypothetical protein [Bdellovibrionales bacterium]HCM40388.1 hypothetical protein [Bdellovibrionales bacterium]
MPSLFDADYIDISISVLCRIPGAAPFDIFIRRAEKTYTKLINKGDPVDYDRLESYHLKKGIESLSVCRCDYQSYLMLAERVAADCVADPGSVTPGEMTDIVKEMANLTMIDLFVRTEMDQRSVAHATDTVKGCITALTKDPTSFINILKMMKHHPYLMKHALATSIFSLLLARKSGFESSRSLLSIGLGALIHDIGITRMTFSPEDFVDLSPDQWKEIRRHPEFGKRLLDPLKQINAEVRAIVLQHHEQPNGNGYPNGLHDAEIYLPAKIISVCDSFSALISDRPHRKAFSPTKALELMSEDRGKLDPQLLNHFAEILMPLKAKAK